MKEVRLWVLPPHSNEMLVSIPGILVQEAGELPFYVTVPIDTKFRKPPEAPILTGSYVVAFNPLTKSIEFVEARPATNPDAPAVLEYTEA